MDRLAEFLIDTGNEPYDVARNSCGAWAIRWMNTRTGMGLELPDIPDWETARATDIPAMFRDYARRFGLTVRDAADRGDPGLFSADHRFVSKTGMAIGIYLGAGMWGFRSLSGVRAFRLDREAEIWGV